MTISWQFGRVADSCVNSWCFVGSPTSLRSVVLGVGTYTAFLLHRATVWYSGMPLHTLQPGIRGSVGVGPKLERVSCASLYSCGNCVNGRSNHDVYLLSLCCVFFLCVVSQALDAVWTILVRACPCIYSDVECIGFGRLLSFCWRRRCDLATKTAFCPSHVQQRCADPHWNSYSLVLCASWPLRLCSPMAPNA